MDVLSSWSTVSQQSISLIDGVGRLTLGRLSTSVDLVSIQCQLCIDQDVNRESIRMANYQVWIEMSIEGIDQGYHSSWVSI